jgi:CRISPR-associated protein Cas2
MTLFISYDFSNNKTRTQFSKFLLKYGRRIQLSVFEIRNSQNYRDKIILEINKKWKPKFTGLDTIWLWELSDVDASKNIHKYGFAAFEDSDVLMLGF